MRCDGRHRASRRGAESKSWPCWQGHVLVPRDAGLTDLGLAVRGSKSHLSRAVLVPEHAEGAMEGLAGVMAREPQIQAVVLDSREALVIFQNVPVRI